MSDVAKSVSVRSFEIVLGGLIIICGAIILAIGAILNSALWAAGLTMQYDPMLNIFRLFGLLGIAGGAAIIVHGIKRIIDHALHLTKPLW